MKRAILISGLVASILLSATPAQAQQIKYVKQKAGQFCKRLFLNDYTIQFDGKKLTCLFDGKHYRWK